jgi:hypothetical protein
MFRKLALIAALGCAVLAGTGESPAVAAPNNGHGIVYNKSDCGGDGSYYNVRMYGNGGRWSGSACGSWGLDRDRRIKVWSNGDHNWSQDELNTIFGKADQAIKTGIKTIGHGVETGVRKFGGEVRHGMNVFGGEMVKGFMWMKDHARLVCRKVVPTIIKQALGRSCKSTAAKFELECNGELDAETEGLAAPACIAGGALILQECKAEVDVTMSIVKPVTKLACDKI